ncbi:MAG: rhodanese-like domain-containing protein [Methylococcaceae bacterium]
MRIISKYCQLTFMAGILLLMVCPVVKADSVKIESISPIEASVMYTQKRAVIVDVREDNEWDEQHIPGAIHIPLAQLNDRLAELKQYKNSLVITQCRSGGRSAKALDVLKSAGFAKVYNMDGGIQAWNKDGLATE